MSTTTLSRVAIYARESPLKRLRGQLHELSRQQIDDRTYFSSPAPAQYHGISAIHREDCLSMSSKKAAIYVKETAGYPDGENSKELQLHHCEEFCKIHDLDIVARYYDGVSIRHDFDWMMG